MQIKELHRLFLRFPKVVTDSRLMVNEGIFFALKGDNFNGNKFVNQAFENGCDFAVVDEEIDLHSEHIIKVDNVLLCLQKLAQFHRNYLGIKILAITGSNGKTTTKELCREVLSKKYNVFATQGNFNNHIGVTLTLLQLEKEHEIGIIEMGANHPGEIKILTEIAMPDFGLITNIGKAHLEGFGSIQGVLKTKMELFDYVSSQGGVVFVNEKNELIKNNTSKIENKITYGLSTSDYFAVTVEDDNFLSCKISSTKNNSKTNIKTSLIGSYNLENVLAAYVIGKEFKVTDEDIKEAVRTYEPSNNRSQLVKTKYNTVVLDAYNANPTSMTESIDAFILNYTAENSVIIVGEMKELGQYTKEEHKSLVEKINGLNISEAYFVGDVFNQIVKSGNVFSSTNDLIQHLKHNIIRNKSILIKGSRVNRLETLVDFI